ncbi:prepilin-type N-terminal cleavage/methylation domain-containing protein [Gemmatimonas sp.]|uniref:PulJ/GspJ family protein n=1 Tax=Gemmatimonas sp. TaxID=1962908 RepID=UPI00286A9D38|nr:prepilin-type N-terminal cleavage/methylation domain-containing protein [Gemmatimonas sp.]
MPRLTSMRRRGFTMVEMLVTMTILSVVGIIVSRLMMGQQRFYQRTNEQMGMRRELRSAMNLVPADLRSISSSGGDLTTFNSTSLTFRAVLGASAVCARPSNSALDLPPLNMARNTVTSWYTTPQAGDTVWAFNDSLSRGAEDDVWVPLRITAVSQSAALCPLSPFIDALLDIGKPRFRVTVSPNLPDSIKVGSAIRFTRSARFQLTAQSSGRYYLTRSEYVGGAWQGATAVSGPYEPPSSSNGGIRFSYFDSLGLAVTNPALGRDVARIDMILRAKGANSSGGVGSSSTSNTDSLAFRIALRNRQ